MRGWIRRLRSGRGDAAPAARADGAPPPPFDPADPAFVADPYPTYAWLRAHEPVHRAPSGAFVLTRYDDVAAALADERLANAPARHAVVHERNRGRYVCADVASRILPFLDPPRHTAPRRRIGRVFHEQLRDAPPDLDGLAQGLLDRLDGRARFDVVADFASPFAVRAIAALLGVPAAEAPRLERWSESFFYLFAPIPSHAVRERLDADLAAFRAFFRDLVAARRAQPGPDLVSALAAARRDDEGLDDAALVDNLMLLFADGVENVDRAIASACWLLLRHPEQLARLRADPASWPAAIDECLRFESPAQFVARIAREEVELRSVRVPRDGVVLLVLGAANRDPGTFADPDRFDVGRRPNPHLAFGRGRHACVGGPLVERELGAALRTLFARFPSLRCDDGARWMPRPAHRWLERLLVTP